MRLRRGIAIAAVAGGVAVTTMLIGLVTNAVSDQSRWPGWLGWLQEHAWFSFILLGVVMVVGPPSTARTWNISSGTSRTPCGSTAGTRPRQPLHPLSRPYCHGESPYREQASEADRRRR